MGRHKAAFVTRRPPTGSCAATFSGAYQWAGCWRRLILWLALIWVSMPAWASPPVVLVLGDSLSAAYGMDLDDGWVSLLQRRLGERGFQHSVANASVSGDTTRSGLTRLQDALDVHRPTVLILELGGNDGLRGIAPYETEANLAGMLDEAQVAGVKVLLVGIRLPPNYGAAYTSRFESIYPVLAERFGVALVPFLLEGVAGNPALMQHDGIHPRAEAQEQMLDNVWPHLESLLHSTVDGRE